MVNELAPVNLAYVRGGVHPICSVGRMDVKAWHSGEPGRRGLMEEAGDRVVRMR